MKRYIAGVVTGLVLSGSIAFAVNYTATDNPFPIQLNGENIELEGYNIDGSTYFKLRDIADKVGGFSVDFQNDTIQLAKDGYVYDNTESLTITDDMKETFKEYCLRIPEFTQDTVTSTQFVDDFIFYFYTGKTSDLSKRTNDLYYGWSKDDVCAQYTKLFGHDMPNTSANYEDGYYWVHVSDFGDIDYTFDSIAETDDGIDVRYKCIAPSNDTFFGYTILHIVPADNDAGYIITSKVSTQN